MNILKAINNWIDRLFGPQSWEKVLANSGDKRMIKLVNTIETVRFMLFPLTLTIALVGTTIGIIEYILAFIQHILGEIHNLLVDCLWIKLSWFNLTIDEVKDTLDKAEVVGNANNQQA